MSNPHAYKMQPLERLVATWECPECNATVEWSYLELVDQGNPVCDDCYCDMEVTNKCRVELG